MQDFDAVALGIRKWADPEHRMRFVALNLPNISPASQVLEWLAYFYNPANHAAGVQDVGSFDFGFHAYPTTLLTSDPASFTNMFAYVEDFVATRWRRPTPCARSCRQPRACIWTSAASTRPQP